MHYISNLLNANPETAHTPILLTVGKMEPFRFEDAVTTNIDGIIIKPYTAGELICAVEKLEKLRQSPVRAVPYVPVTQLNPSTDASKERTRCATGLPTDGASGTAVRDGFASAIFRAEAGQLCDVCGHVNSDDAFVCEQCDVPLPIAVIPSGNRATHKTGVL